MIVFNKNGNKDFVVLNFTDTQLLTHEWEENCVGRRVLEYTVNKLVEEVKPDLLTVSGDISAAEYPEAYTKFADMMDKFDIPWTVVWGNHDNQCGAETISKYVAEYKTYKNFVYEEGPKEIGNGNFVIEICENGKPVHGIVMMDTHDRVEYKGEWAWAKIVPEQIEWYKKTVAELSARGCGETTIISHIPIYAYRLAYEAAFNKAFSSEKLTYIDTFDGECWNEGYKNSYGINLEGICSFEEDEGMFDAIKEMGSTKLYICGHDHINTTCIEYQGVKLMYALKTGRGCYYKEPYNGGTVIRIGSDGKAVAEHKFCDEGI